MVAAQRDDVNALYSYAGNLDVVAWVAHHDITPLDGSLNPAAFAASLYDIPQVHYVGAKDKIVPPSIAYSYARRFPADAQPEIVIKSGYDHHCCWAK